MRFFSTILLLFAISVATSCQGAPQHRQLRVAFVISDGFNMIDFAGPWEVFQDVMLPNAGNPSKMGEMPFTLFTVSESTSPVKSTGGAAVTPEYSFANAPDPDIVVIGAQGSNSRELLDWLRKKNSQQVTLMSVCTGASKLARSGLIDGKQATSHHGFITDFQKQFPKIDWQRSKRYVRSTENIYTAGGLTSGIDLALHMVAKYFGSEVAQTTAEFMEYQGSGWKQAD